MGFVQQTSIGDATTSQKGAVQLQNSIDTSTTTAVTPNAVKSYISGTTIGGIVYASAQKKSPHDNDRFGYSDTEASNVLKYMRWASIKARLKDYFDSLYAEYRASAYLSSNMTGFASSTTPSIIKLNAEKFDPGSDFNTTTFLYKVPITGYYLVTGCVTFSPGATGTVCAAFIYVNGARAKDGDTAGITSTAVQRRTVSGIIYLEANDEVTLYASQVTGKDCVINGSATGTDTFLDVHLLSV